METRSQTRAKAVQSPGPPEGVLENPAPRSPTGSEDLGLVGLMGDGETLLVGPGQAEVRAITSGSGDTAVSERAPDREPISEVPEPPPFTLSPETSARKCRLSSVSF